MYWIGIWKLINWLHGFAFTQYLLVSVCAFFHWIPWSTSWVAYANFCVFLYKWLARIIEFAADVDGCCIVCSKVAPGHKWKGGKLLTSIYHSIDRSKSKILYQIIDLTQLPEIRVWMRWMSLRFRKDLFCHLDVCVVECMNPNESGITLKWLGLFNCWTNSLTIFS